jgi:hypothetical protein
MSLLFFESSKSSIILFSESCWCSNTSTVFGTLSKTIYGKECQNWSENYPHRPKYRNNGADNNYCANPDNDHKGPWCYTTDPNTRYEVISKFLLFN